MVKSIVIKPFRLDKKNIYSLLIRRKKFMPAFKSRINTVKFFHDILNGDIMVPNSDDVHPIVLADPPSKAVLKKLLLQALEEPAAKSKAVSKLASTLRVKDVDSAWLLSMLYLADKHHEIFDPNYVAPRNKKRMKGCNSSKARTCR